MSDMEDAIRFYYRGEIFEAEKILKRILREQPEHINALIRYAAIQEDLGRVEEAGTVFLKIAELYEKEGSHEEGLEFLEKASPSFPQAKISPLKGKCLFSLGRYTEALSHFLVSPQDNRNLFYIGKIYFVLNQHNNALRIFREILSRATDTGEIFRACYWIGKSLYALGELEEAISCFTSYISVYPNEPRVFLDLAVCYLNSGRFEEARSHLLQFRSLGGNGDTANLYLGIVNYRLGHYKEAVDLFDQTSLGEQALHWKGLTHYEMGLYEDALQCFSIAAKYEAKPLYFKMMGNAHLKRGSVYEAKICYEKALSIDPSDEDLHKLVSISGHLLKTEKPQG